MATSPVYDTIKATLVTGLAGAYPLRDWEEIDQLLSQSGVPFLALEETDEAVELRSVGTPESNWAADTGTIDVHIFVPSDGSLTVARGIGAIVRTALQYQHFTGAAVQGLRVTAVDPPGPGIISDGLWHSMVVSVEYSHQYAVATA